DRRAQADGARGPLARGRAGAQRNEGWRDRTRTGRSRRCEDLHSPAVKPADLSAIVDRNIALGAFDGAALAVLRGEEPVFQRYAGEAAPGLPAGPDVLWPLASI